MLIQRSFAAHNFGIEIYFGGLRMDSTRKPFTTPEHQTFQRFILHLATTRSSFIVQIVNQMIIFPKSILFLNRNWKKMMKLTVLKNFLKTLRTSIFSEWTSNYNKRCSNFKRIFSLNTKRIMMFHWIMTIASQRQQQRQNSCAGTTFLAICITRRWRD